MFQVTGYYAITLKILLLTQYSIYLSLRVSAFPLTLQTSKLVSRKPQQSCFTRHLETFLAQGNAHGFDYSSNTKTSSFLLTKLKEKKHQKWKQIISPVRSRHDTGIREEYHFQYNYNQTILSPNFEIEERLKTTIVLLLQPIGVGIGRWYYDRLLLELEQFEGTCMDGDGSSRYVFLAPDLLGCGTACDPELITRKTKKGGGDETATVTNQKVKKLPLLGVEDWSNQIFSLMKEYEEELQESEPLTSYDSTFRWCIVSNGGCVPIALEIGKQYVDGRRLSNSVHESKLFNYPLTNLVLSAPPRLSALLRLQNTIKIQKSYRTLSGLAGKLFWWYSLRNKGAFIQKFSEKNLAARPENLGDGWTPKCVETAKAFRGKSRYSTFSFLAGSLNGGSQERLDILGGSDVKIDVITGGDKRKNPARSWFWERRPKQSAEGLPVEKDNPQITSPPEVLAMTLPEFLKQNGNRGREIVVGGRRCPAHEDPKGFANALMSLIN